MEKTEKRKTGDIGEDIACEYLKKNGCRIILRNFRQKFGEIDIVAKAKDKTLLFVEVKTMHGDMRFAGLTSEDQMSAAKIKKTKRICEGFANAHPELINERMGWRIDLIAITLSGGFVPLETARDRSAPASLMGLTNNEKNCDIRYYENVS